jgi:UDP-glucose 4-epimerase
MRVVVVGATGNIGTALLRRLSEEPGVELAGIARRLPGRDAGHPYDRVSWHRVDVGSPDAVSGLRDAFAGADAVVHLAWLIQPSHDRRLLRRVNVLGTAHVIEATLRAGVPALVVASSVGAYAPGPKDTTVDESWPTTGVPRSGYSSDKATVERLLDQAEDAHPQLRLVRLRPGLAFQRTAGSEIDRYFLGPLAPTGLLRRGRLPLVPRHPRLRVQAVHTDDVADAYTRAVLSDVRGAFNIAAEPILDAASVTQRFGGIQVPTPPTLLWWGAALTWIARLQPTDPGWLALAVSCPLMSTTRARAELGWQPKATSLEAMEDLIAGLAGKAGAAGPPLRPGMDGRLRAVLGAVRLPGHGNPY